MFERLTLPARESIALAQDFARSASGEPLNGAELVVGFARSEGSVAGRLLRQRVTVGELEEAVRNTADADGRRASGAVDTLTAVLAGGAGVSLALGQRRISSAACLLGILALESPSAAALFAVVGIDVDDLVASLREVDDSSEGDPFADDSADDSWTITVGDDVPEELRRSSEHP